MAILKQIITLTQSQYDTIKNDGVITVKGKNYTYDTNTLYLVPENTPDIKYGSTSYWTSLSNYIPAAGEIIIYTDKDVIIDEGQTKNIPGIKIGDGLAYGIDLPFIGDEKAAELINHINNNTMHITTAERVKWNNKITCENTVADETLILTKN